MGSPWSRDRFLLAARLVRLRVSLPVVTAWKPRRGGPMTCVPCAPAWGWEVAAYTWTKSIGTGAVSGRGRSQVAEPGRAPRRAIAVSMGVVALIFLTLTAGLLVADPETAEGVSCTCCRGPQWRSWLVRGA